MRVEYFETRIKHELPALSQELIDLVKDKTVSIFSTIQFLDQRDELAAKLLKYCKIINLKLAHCTYPDQILGCSVFDSEIVEKPDLFLYLGDGVFHPSSLVLNEFAEQVYCLSPLDLSIKKITKDDVKNLLNKKKVALTNFLSAKNIGILITLKLGQNALKKAVELKNSEKYKDKNFYLFLDDTINFQDLENFNFIDSWINTACPRIAYDDCFKISKGIINLQDIL